MDAYREEYENYEPELKVWPYILLGFLIPAVPFLCNILLHNAGFIPDLNILWGAANFLVISIAFFVTAKVIRTSYSSWLFAVDGALYFISTLILWVYGKTTGVAGYALSMPFSTAIVPAFVLMLIYAFYAKRSRLPAGGTISIIIALVSILFTVVQYLSYEAISLVEIVYLVMPSALFLLSLFTLFVTKRSETAPWYINLVLIVFVFDSLLVEPEFSSMISSGATAGEYAVAILKEIATSYRLWFFISCCLIYAGIGMKSCFKSLKKPSIPESDVDQEITVKANTDPAFDMDNSRYAFPPKDNRYTSNDEGVKEYREEPRYDESPRRAPVRRDYDERDTYYDAPPRPMDDRRAPQYEDDYYSERTYRERGRYRGGRYDDYYQDDYDDRDRYPDTRSRKPQYDRYIPDDRRDLDYPERSQRRSQYRDDQYRGVNSQRSERDKWYDLLRGAVDDDEFRHKRPLDDRDDSRY